MRTIAKTNIRPHCYEEITQIFALRRAFFPISGTARVRFAADLQLHALEIAWVDDPAR